MPNLGRGRISVLWLAAAVLLFAVNASAWRDSVSSPAGTIVHVSTKGSDLVPWIKALALLAIVIAVVSLFANRMVILVLSGLAGILSLATLGSTLGKLNGGPAQVGVTTHIFWLPEAGALLGALSGLALALITPLSARAWTIARYRAGEKSQGVTTADLWRAQDAGHDPTRTDD